MSRKWKKKLSSFSFNRPMYFCEIYKDIWQFDVKYTLKTDLGRNKSWEFKSYLII